MVGRLWRGEYGLPVSWWGFGFTVTFVVSAVMVVLPLPVVGMLTLAFLPYDVVWMVGTWRAVQTYAGPAFWSVVVCAFLVLNWIAWVPGVVLAAALAFPPVLMVNPS